MAAAMAGAATLPALGEVYTYVGGDHGAWNSSANWSPSTGYPDDDEDDAIIPAGKIVGVYTTSTTGSINVQQHENGTRGVIVINLNATLELGTDRSNVVSVVNGYVVFQGCSIEHTDPCPENLCPATLRLMDDDVTITSDTGKNGEIRGRANWSDGEHPAFSGGYIYTRNADTPDKLILEGSVILAGHLGVYCALENNATVMVDDPRGVGTNGECNDCDQNIDCEEYEAPELCWKDHMILGTPISGDPEDFPKTGTGDWIVTGGTMTFRECGIDTSGDWTVFNPCDDDDITGIDHSLLEFESTAVIDCLSGDFTVFGGRLKTHIDLQTSGKLTFYSPKNAVQPEIFVAEGKTAVFSEVCP